MLKSAIAEKEMRTAEEINDPSQNLWQDIRQDFVKVFNIRHHSSKMDQLVNNPFG